MIRSIASSPIYIRVSIIAISLVLSLLIAIFYSQTSHAVSGKTAGFDAGNIMSDAVMSNKNTMTQSQIQSFLNSKNTCKTTPKSSSVLDYINSGKTYGYLMSGGTKFQYHLKDGKFICLADQDFNGESAARIIYRASQDYNINPQVLIVLLQKENGLITDNWPNYNFQYATATGYACPDSGPNNSANCNSNYFGFKNQVRHAASMFRSLLNGYGTNNYPVGSNEILHSPNCSSTTSVSVKNRATGALYTYTPYQPNSATLSRDWPITQPYPACGAYGNLNFYMMFKQWFGNTQYQLSGSILNKYNQLGGKDVVGMPIGNPIRLSTSSAYQKFDNGIIYWNSGVGTWYINGGIGNKYVSLDGHNGTLGLPSSDAAAVDNGAYQQFEGGRIYWSSNTGARMVSGGISNKYHDAGGISVLGFPRTDAAAIEGGAIQEFEKGSIYWSSSTGANIVRGAISKKYSSVGGVSILGFPKSNAVAIEAGGAYQQFEGGRIYWISGEVSVEYN